MKKFRRALALLLALAMLFSTAVISEEAPALEQAEEPEQIEVQTEEAPEASEEEFVEEEAAEEIAEEEPVEEPVEGEATEGPVEAEPTEEPAEEIAEPEETEEPSEGEPEMEPEETEKPSEGESEAEPLPAERLAEELGLTLEQLAAELGVSMEEFYLLDEAALLALYEQAQEYSLEMETFNANSDFVIDENGVLVKYKGLGGDVIIPDGVTGIGDYVFTTLSFLKSLTIPESVTNISNLQEFGSTALMIVVSGSYAERYCREQGQRYIYLGNQSDFGIDENGVLTGYRGSSDTVTIPDGVKSIGSGAFSGCKMKSVTIPTGVTSIGNEAFRFCTSLESVTIPSSVTSIGYEAFWKCSSLENVTIATGVKSIGEYAFYHCESLESIEIPSSVTALGYGVFSFCFNLKSIDIPDSVTSLGQSAFDDCKSLKSVHIGSGLTILPNSAFGSCTALESIDIPDNIKSIGPAAFNDCDALQNIHIGKGVTSIDRAAFSDCDSLKSIVIPEGVKSIGYWAFLRCDSLLSINIPESVTSIGEEIFERYGRILTVEVVSGSYGEQYCKDNYVQYKYPGSDQIYAPWYEESDKFAFDHGVLLRYVASDENVVIPDNVTSIGDSAFFECDFLKSVDIPNSVTSIGEAAFKYCSSLKSVDIPSSVTSIGKYAFGTCSHLRTVHIAEGLTSIGEWAFSSDFDLTSITIPESVKVIGDYAFEDHDEKLKATVVKDSYAEQYCKENEIKCIVALGYVTVQCTPDAITLSQSTSQTIKATSEGLGKKEKYTYSSSDKKIATVSSKGKITAKNPGTAVITVQGKTSKQSATCIVTVLPKPKSIKIVPPETTDLIVEDTLQLNYELDPVDAMTTVKWKSSSKSVAVIDQATGLLRATGIGTASITATTSNKKKSKSLKITVTDPYMPTGVQLDQTGTVELDMSNTLTLQASLQPLTAQSDLTWKSSNKKIATVENGVVKPLKEGKVKITVTTAKKNAKGKKMSASVTLKVVNANRPTGIALENQTKITLAVGESKQLIPTLTPSTAVTGLTWKTSKKKYVTVDQQGIITGIKKGKSTISVVTYNGKTAKCVVTVN